MNKKSDETEEDKEPGPAGVFVTKGMELTIPSFSIGFNENGELNVGPVHVHTKIDLCPYWLEIAYEHLLATEVANKKLTTATEKENDEDVAKALAVEFTAGMQTIMASVIAIDAYYANIVEKIEIPRELIKTWREKKTARYAQVSEVLRLAFQVKNESFKQLRNILKEVYKYRDWAVHPPAEAAVPIIYPEINKATDWRFAAFRYHNANAILKHSLSVILQTAEKPRSEKYPNLQKYSETIKINLEPTVGRWEEKFGAIYG